MSRIMVTGAASGIGAATVRAALAAGHQVAALDADPDRLTRAWDGEPVLTVACDVTDAAAITTAGAQARRRPALSADWRWAPLRLPPRSRITAPA